MRKRLKTLRVLIRWREPRFILRAAGSRCSHGCIEVQALGLIMEF